MKRVPSFLALVASCATGATTVHAQGTVQLSGLVDLYVGRMQRSGQSAATSVVGSGGLTRPWFGFSGREDLGQGYSAHFSLEGFFQADTGNATRGTPGDGFFSRQSAVGLSGPFGSLELGRTNAPNFFASQFSNPLGASFAFSPLFLHSYIPTNGDIASWPNSIAGDTGWSNSVRYETPRYAGWSASFNYQLGEAVSGKRNLGASLRYVSDAMQLWAFHQKVELNNPNNVALASGGVTDQRTSFVGGSYDWRAFKLFASYQRVRTDTPLRDRTVQAGLSIPVGSGRILADWARTQRTTASGKARRNTATLGYDHFLSRRTDLYLLAMYDRIAGANSAQSYAVGIRHRF